MTSYICKVVANSENWEFISKLLTSQYFENPFYLNKTLRSLVGENMSAVSGSMSITGNQSKYIIGGGTLKRILAHNILKCSLTSMPLAEIIDHE